LRLDCDDGGMTADEVIARLQLEPHPEGGHYRETWRDEPTGDGRGVGTAIYFLLREGERSAWHRVDADELWHFHAGDALTLQMSPDDTTASSAVRLGIALDAGEQPQARVPAGWWQSAESTGAWTLVGCTVAPAFHFDGFEIAPEGFEPGAGQ
jgi:uncharacterized protein